MICSNPSAHVVCLAIFYKAGPCLHVDLSVCGLWSVVCGVLDNFEPSDWLTRLSLVIWHPFIGRRSSECFGGYAGVAPDSSEFSARWRHWFNMFVALYTATKTTTRLTSIK